MSGGVRQGRGRPIKGAWMNGYCCGHPGGNPHGAHLKTVPLRGISWGFIHHFLALVVESLLGINSLAPWCTSGVGLSSCLGWQRLYAGDTEGHWNIRTTCRHLWGGSESVMPQSQLRPTPTEPIVNFSRIFAGWSRNTATLENYISQTCIR